MPPPKCDEKDPIKVRNSYKGQLTNFSTYLSKLTEQTLSTSDANELNLRIGKLMKMFERFDEVQLEIECGHPDMQAQLVERTEFESLYYRLISQAQQLYDSHNKHEHSTKSSNHGNIVKLPTIQLPKFSGSYENWLEFHDTFTSLIHNNSDIDDVNKFHYLRASLDGSAAIVIKSIELSANNYSVAWKVLCDRFDNKRLLVQNHVSAIFDIANLTKECSVSLKRMIDQINKNLRALESLGEPVEHWDTLLIYLITRKLDAKTYREWEEFKGRLDNSQVIDFDKFQTFLRSRADLVETLELSRNPSSHPHTKSTNNTNSKIKAMVSVQASPPKCTGCPKCQGDHSLSDCAQFLSLNNEARYELLPTLKVCYNCFSTGHFANTCKKKGCKVCKNKHNTLVHLSDFKSKHSQSGPSSLSSMKPMTPSNVSQPTPPPSPNENVVLSASVVSSHCGKGVLLATALIKVYDSQNREHIVRALLDNGSTSCLMTEGLYARLNLPFNQVNKSIVGVNNVSSVISKRCRVQIKSLNDSFSTHLQCFVLPSITDCIPSSQVNLLGMNIPSEVILADPYFHTPAAIDLIIGADMFWDILGAQRISLGQNKPTLVETRLGWIVSGPIDSILPSHPIKCNFSKVDSSNNVFVTKGDDLQSLLARFWQLEEVQCPLSDYSKEEKACEEHFLQNTTRSEDGRFCVKIPLKKSPELLGESFNKAKGCFLSLERRFERQQRLSSLYKDFMAEYEALGHMSVCDSVEETAGHFIPHHGVLRDSSTTTKLRAVFNASNLTTSGISYNDIQMVGPTVQDDLLSILLRFRQHKFILAADVEKMYRQVSVHSDCRYLQQIVWRSDPSADLKTYQLNTVTYGTASAPYLATRCLKQVGLESKHDKVKEVIVHDFYVDDLLTGGDTIDEVQYIKSQVTAELASARMPLRKWKSNEPSLIDHDEIIDLNIGAKEPSKTLGLSWHAGDDTLRFPIDANLKSGHSKRDVLSVTAQIFDPLGLLSPYVIVMKMLLQKLWLNKLSWDDPLPSEISQAWREIVNELPCLNNISIPRFVVSENYKWVDLHIFSDASEKAYGACLYVRSINGSSQIKVKLLMAKSRVAPIKPTTIPRLELCGALVSTRLYEKAIKSLRLKIRSIVYWTDSMIVLGWLRMMPSKLQPFVRNRVADILEKSGNSVWRHVPTNQNPADFISRGVNANSLSSLEMWWSGPRFLQNEESQWPAHTVRSHESLPETRPEVVLNSIVANESPDKLIDFNRFSKLSKLQRTVAYVLRFISACKKQTFNNNYISKDELQQAMNLIIIMSQKESFPEYELLNKNKSLPRKSSLIKFSPFIDNENLMRVGGRLDNSNFSYDKKHPIIIQSTHRVSKLLFESEHKRLMHAGPQLLLHSIRDNYWPIGGKGLAKACYRQCNRCVRMKGRTLTPLMGNLPLKRITPSYPFENVGVDYAGPIASLSRQGRGSRVVKVYIVVFICFSTKAIHLELVGDLTSNNYLLALRRFISRRGKPLHVYSDNGTTFVGASNELSNFLKTTCNSIAEDAANDGINFHFIPAYSPHFGGLWEAGVKSTKFHLYRVLGQCHLTYEELNSTLIQIEAILNSRPLTPLSSDPEDFMPLTPGHFLIGRPLTSLPSQDYSSASTNHLTRHQRIEQLRQRFWTRWSKEYVSELQQRVKWRRNDDNKLKMNAMVVIKEDHLPPLKWKLGRIVAVHPGGDGINRVADVKTSTGVVRRSFSRICPLPEDEVVESEASNARGHV